jgi:hypothetical protein
VSRGDVVVIWLIIGFVLVVVIYMGAKMRQASRPLGFAQQLAKTQLRSFYAFRNKYPNLPKQDLYSMVITSRPGYDAQLASEIISGAGEVAEQMGASLRFWMVILQLAAYEYLSRTGQSPSPVMDDLRSGVVGAIPPEL